MKVVVLGLSLSSSWGNGHATTFRALLKGLAELGAEALFLERRTPWYGAHADLSNPDFCELAFYDSPDDLHRWANEISQADLVLVGSYVPDGIRVIDAALALAPGRTAFYDIDTPVTLAALERGACDYLAPRQIPKFSAYFSFTGGPMLETLVRRYRARDAQALYCAVDPSLYQPTGEPAAWDLGYLGTYSDDRQPTLRELLIEPARLLPHMRFVVAGPQYPAHIEWPANVERIEHLGPADHASFYSRQRFTLNVTRADMVRAGWSPSVRLFEAACCAAPIISDVWPGLDVLFSPGEDIVFARTAADVAGALTKISEDDRRRIGANARKRVRAGHTGAMRARQLVAAARGAQKRTDDAEADRIVEDISGGARV
ncbi:MAG: glycosyltransferase protein [Hyphomicrobiales bacterium]|nr:glycosyltransferase protein [Hyphomicrobiales bacterium]